MVSKGKGGTGCGELKRVFNDSFCFSEKFKLLKQLFVQTVISKHYVHNIYLCKFSNLYSYGFPIIYALSRTCPGNAGSHQPF